MAEAYRRHGYVVTVTLGGGGADGGIDLVLHRGGKKTLVQCKRWKARPVPVQTVRELYGVVTAEGADAAKLVATTTFTSEAIAFARGKPIELIDATDLLELLRNVQNSGNLAAPVPEQAPQLDIPTCPLCSSPMKERVARRGADAGSRFWGCSRYPACKGTR